MPGLNLVAKVSLDGSGFQAGITRMQRGVKGFSDSLNNTLKSRVAMAFGTAAIGLSVKHTVDEASRISDLSKRLAVSAEKLQEFGYAAKQNGADLDSVTTALERMNVARAEALDGNLELQKSFETLGVSMADLKTKRADDIYRMVGDAVKNGDPQALGKQLRDVGGKGIGNLIASFEAGLGEMAKQAHDKSLVMRDAVVDSLDALGDQFDDLRSVMVVGLGEGITWTIGKIYDLIDGLKNFGAFLGSLAGDPDFNLKNVGKSLTETSKHPEGMGWWEKLWTVPQKGSGPGTDALSGAINRAIEATAEIKSVRPAGSSAPSFERMNFDEAESKDIPSSRRGKQMPGDSLVSVGNFLGSRQDVVSAIAEKTLEIARSHVGIAQKHTELFQKQVALLERLTKQESESTGYMA